MKKLLILCLVVFAFGAPAEAKTQVKAVTTSFTTTSTTFDNPYRVGEFHRRIPRRAVRVVINNRVYFTHRGVYYEPTRRGFVVVPRPRVYRRVQPYRSNRGYGRDYYRYNYGNRYGSPRGGCRR